jgi:hypothetical protein
MTSRDYCRCNGDRHESSRRISGRLILNGIRKLPYQSDKLIEVMCIPCLEDRTPDLLPCRVYHIGHFLAFPSNDSLAHPTVGGISPAFNQSEAFELRDLATYRGVVAPYPAGQIHYTDRPRAFDSNEQGE